MLAAGLIVMVAIAGLLVIGIPFIGKLGLAAAIAVGAVVVSALTVLPTMIGALKRWLKPKKPEHVRPRARSSAGASASPRARGVSIAAGVVLLLILAFPVTQMRLGQPDDGNQPETRTQRVAYDQLSAAFGAGSNGPFLLAVDTPKDAPGNEQQLQALAGRRRRRRASPASRRRDQRGRRDGDDLRRPDDRAAGREDERPARARCATT